MKLLTFSIALLMCVTSYSQTVEIPDENFAAWLNENYPQCMDGNMMDTQCSSIIQELYVDCSNKDIANLEGVQYFTSMLDLNAANNEFNEVPLLPEGLEILSISYNDNVSLFPSEFPSSLKTLDITSCNSITILPSLPEGLLEFRRSNTSQLDTQVLPSSLLKYSARSCLFTEMPELPIGLEELDILNNNLGNQTAFPPELLVLNIRNTGMDILPELPSNLTILYADNQPFYSFDNELTSLPNLPQSLLELYLDFNEISELPSLPSNLTRLSVGFNNLTSVTVPSSIEYLYISDNNIEFVLPPVLPNCVEFHGTDNQLTTAPIINDSAWVYNLFDNNITCINWLPSVVGVMNIENNPITCIPFIPEISISYPELEGMPICQENDPVNNPNGCESGSGIDGYVHLDSNNDCLINESPLVNIPINIQNFGSTSTFSNGRFFFNDAYGNYTVSPNLESVPFINNCEDSYSVELNADNPYEEGLNFALQCAYENDMGVQSVITSGWVFPGQYHTTSVSAGELSQFYNANCSGSISGEVLISLTGPAVITGAPDGALEPSSFTDNSASFLIEDFTAIDLINSFRLEILTETFATDDDELCLNIQVISSEDDPVIENNQLTFCYPVVNSYDPNNKLVSPMTVEPGFEGWLHYTINFQNTGSAPAFNVRLQDLLPQNLDAETFQMTNTSHESYYELENNALTVYYPDIMLADSTSNEAASKGYFQFKIHTLNPLELGEILLNSAGIFFDFNDPIVTNAAITEAQLPDFVGEINETEVNVFPNPFSEGFVLESNNMDGKELVIYTLLGKEVYSTIVRNDQEQIDLSSLTDGAYILELGGVKKKLLKKN